MDFEEKVHCCGVLLIGRFVSFTGIFLGLGLFTQHLTLEVNVESHTKPIFRCRLRVQTSHGTP
jgi:hypothetical protein